MVFLLEHQWPRLSGAPSGPPPLPLTYHKNAARSPLVPEVLIHDCVAVENRTTAGAAQ
jgi:hypothetical protein